MTNVKFKHCILTLQDELPATKETCSIVTNLGFKIVSIEPLRIEGESVTKEKICELTNTLQKCLDPQEGDGCVRVEESSSGNFKFSGNDYPCDKTSSGAEAELKKGIGKSTDSSELAFSHSSPARSTADKDHRNTFPNSSSSSSRNEFDNLSDKFTNLSLTEDPLSKANELNIAVTEHDQDPGKAPCPKNANGKEFPTEAMSENGPQTDETASPHVQHNDASGFETKHNQKESRKSSEKSSEMHRNVQNQDVQEKISCSHDTERDLSKLNEDGMSETTKTGGKSSIDIGNGKTISQTKFGTDENTKVSDVKGQRPKTKNVGGKQCNTTVSKVMEKNADQTKKRTDEKEETSYCESLEYKENSNKSEATHNFVLKENSNSENGKHFNDGREITRGLPGQQDEDIAGDSNVKCGSIRQQQSVSESDTAGPTEVPKTNAQMHMESNRNNADVREREHCRPCTGENVSPIVRQIGIHSSTNNRRTFDVSQARPETKNFDGITNIKDSREEYTSTSQSTGTKDEGKEESGESQALNSDEKETDSVRTHEGRQKECSQGKLAQQTSNRNKQGEERNDPTESLESSPKPPETIKESENNRENHPDTAKTESDDEEELEDNIHRETDSEKYNVKTTSISCSKEENDEEQAVERGYGHLNGENNTQFAMMQDQEEQQADTTSSTWTNKLSSERYEDLNYNSEALNSCAKVEDHVRNHQGREQNYTQTKVERGQIRRENSTDDHSTRSRDREHGHEYRPENVAESPADEKMGAFSYGFHSEEDSCRDTWNGSSLEDDDHGECEDNLVEISLKRERLELALRYLGLTSKEEYMYIIDDTDPVKIQIDVNLDGGKKFQSDLKKVKFVVLPFRRHKIEYAEMLHEIQKRWPQKILVADNKILIGGFKDDIERTEEYVTEFLRKNERATTMPLNKDILSGSQRIDAETSAGDRSSPYVRIKQDTHLGARPKQPSLSSRIFLAPTSGREEEEIKAQHAMRRNENTYRGHYSKLAIHIEKEDITKMEVDAIVNAANRHLLHGGGVARAISLAAGRALDKACTDVISRKGPLSVTEVFVSPGGRLHAKHVLHAVGPKWISYQDKYQCELDLRKTILQCLIEATKLGASTLALPSVSAAIFKVPPEICAQNYMEAVKHFDEWKKYNSCSLNDIYFVDLNDIMVNHIIECFKNKWEQQCVCSPESKKAELMSSSQQRHPNLGSSTVSQPARYSDTYHIGNIGLRISQKYTMDIRADIVVVIGRLFSRMSGLHYFEAQKNFEKADNLPATKDKFCFGYLSKPNGSSSRLICKVKLKPHDLEKSFKYLKTVPQNMKNSTTAGHSITHVVITSELLYQNTKDTKKDQENRTLVSKFSLELHQWLSEISASRQSDLASLSTVTVTADRNYLPLIQQVFESRRNVIRTVQPTSPDRKSHFTAQSDVHHLSSRGPGQRTDSSREAENMSHRQSPSDIHHSFAHGPRDRRDSSSEGYMSDRQSQSDIHLSSSHGPRERGDSSSKDRKLPRLDGNDVNQPYSHRPGQSGDSLLEKEDYKSHSGSQSARHHSSSREPGEGRDSSLEADTNTSDDSRPECRICYDNKTDFVTPCCKASICSVCREKIGKGLCPFCRKAQGIMCGDQPDGNMSVTYCYDSADGYEGYHSWRIEYFIRGGVQKKMHPNPGKRFDSLMRTAYLPDTDTGRHVLMLLKIAFNRRLIFTIGTSLTRQKDDVLTWNDIHHKTRLHGGSHGYPDPTYLDNVIWELANKGVDLQNLTPEEHKDLEAFSTDLKFKSKKYD